MPDEVANIERRVSEAKEVKIEQPETLPILQDLSRIKIPMNPGRTHDRQRSSESRRSFQETLEPFAPFRMDLCHARQTLFQNPKLIRAGMNAVRWNRRFVKLVGRRGNAPDEFGSIGLRDEFGRFNSRRFDLEPHLELRNHPRNLWHRDPILTRRIESPIPGGLQHFWCSLVHSFGSG